MLFLVHIHSYSFFLPPDGYRNGIVFIAQQISKAWLAVWLPALFLISVKEVSFSGSDLPPERTVVLEATYESCDAIVKQQPRFQKAKQVKQLSQQNQLLCI